MKDIDSSADFTKPTGRRTIVAATRSPCGRRFHASVVAFAACWRTRHADARRHRERKMTMPPRRGKVTAAANCPANRSQRRVRPLAQKPVGRVEEDQVAAHRRRALAVRVEPTKQVARDDLARGRATPSVAMFFSSRLRRRAIGLEERRERRPAAEALQPHAAGPGEAVVDRRVRDQRGEDVEQRLLHPVGDRPGGVALGREQPSPAEFACDDAHASECSDRECFTHFAVRSGRDSLRTGNPAVRSGLYEPLSLNRRLTSDFVCLTLRDSGDFAAKSRLSVGNHTQQPRATSRESSSSWHSKLASTVSAASVGWSSARA